MNAPSPSMSSTRSAEHPPHDLLAQGDQRWAQQPQTWRERELAMPWPPSCWKTLPCAWPVMACVSVAH